MRQSTEDNIPFTITGKYRGIPIWLYEYSFRYSPDSRMEWTVACLRPTEAASPDFELRGTELHNKVKRQRDVMAFRDHKAFSKKYWLRASDEQRLRDYFNQDMIHYFENHAGWGVEGRGEYLLVYRSGRPEPATLSQTVEETLSLFRLMMVTR